MNIKKSKLENLCKFVRKRPAMFLPSLFSDQSLNPTIMFASFLQSISDGKCLSMPSSIQAIVKGEHCIIHADNCSLDLSMFTDMDKSLFESDPLEWILQKALPIDEGNFYLAPFIHILALVCLSGFSQFDISIDLLTHFREVFLNGECLSNMSLMRKKKTLDFEPYLRLAFVPSSDIFGTSFADTRNLLKVFDKFIDEHEMFHYAIIGKHTESEIYLNLSTTR